MKAAGRLALGVLAWAALIPLAGVLGLWLDRSVFHSAGATRVIAHAIEGVLILAAALVYWRCVPSAPNWGRRVIYLVGFALLLAGIGYVVLGATVALVVLLFGL
ncbi:hypothetical protein J2W27_004888 [Variovorax boronicumulans]|uniref:hypothetical protein n=1 Tax=Variovorax boronicumulans TaxID=436515 RepID=UPI00277E2A5E|nr:hypothetical protein [Variovorax boronicumulans]MDP9912762.1 hypothetical protein [Variovorax boronicumulans]